MAVQHDQDAILVRGGTFTRWDFSRTQTYRAMFGVTRYSAVRELKRLVDEGYLLLEGERRAARYVPGPALGVAPEL